MKWVFSILIVAGIAFFIPQEVVEDFPPQTKTETIEIILVGDIMLDRGVEYVVQEKGNNDFRFPFLKIADDLKQADIVFGNLEGPISDKGERVGSIYSFRAEPETIEGLSFAGFNILSLANNHVFDYGREALEDTLRRLKEADIDYVGAGFDVEEAYSPIIKEISDSTGLTQTKIAFLAYTNLGSPFWGVSFADWDNLKDIEKQIKTAKGKADILIVSIHAGEEYKEIPTQFQIEFSKMAVDAGADLIVGHHPHVVQPNEKYKEGYIFYSLGNFVFDQGFSEETMRGEMVKVLIENKKVKEVVPIEIQINNNFQPGMRPLSP